MAMACPEVDRLNFVTAIFQRIEPGVDRSPGTVRLAIWFCAALAAACATSPTGRQQLALFPADEMTKLGAASFQQVSEETPPVQDSRINGYVECVARAITSVVPGQRDWKVTVFKDDKTVNAFALPGGYIGVYTGLLTTAQTPAQLAAVIGHEVGHVIANHANARLSAQYATQAGLGLVQAVASGQSENSDGIMSALGLGAQVGILLPYGRAQESEADELGLQYMAQAGFDPRQSVELWRNMESQGGQQPPEFLSTHPANENRIADLNSYMNSAMNLYQQARAQGHTPNCTRPAQI